MRSKVRKAKRAGARKEKGKEKRLAHKVTAEERQMNALKAKMSHYKKGSKEHKAALRKMAALKKKNAAKIRAAKRAGKRAGIRKEKRIVKKEARKLSKEEHAMRALKA